MVHTNRSWWQQRTQGEHISMVLLVIAAALIIALIAALVLVTYKNRIREEDEEEDKDEVCITSGCVEAAAMLLKNMDQSIDPCDDFYEFACGNFIRNTVIPSDKSEVGPFEDLGDAVQIRLKLALEEPSSADELRPLKLVKKFFNLCADEDRFEDLTDVKELINDLGGWPMLEGNSWDEKSFSWRESVYKFRRKGFYVFNFIKIEIAIDAQNSSQTVIYLDQADLDFARQTLVSGSRGLYAIGYHQYLVDMAVLFGADRESAERDVADLIEFQVQLANISLPEEEHRKTLTSYEFTTVRELQQHSPGIYLLELLTKFIGLPDVTITNAQRIRVIASDYLSKVGYLLNRTTKRAQANHAIFQLLPSINLYLPKAVRDYEQQYNIKTFGHATKPPRWHDCVTETSKLAEVAVGALFVRKYFDEESKRSAIEMANNIKNAFRNVLKETEWMDDDTKEKAVEKASAIRFYVGYSDEYFDDKEIETQYSELQVTSDNIFHFLGNATVFGYNQVYRTLGKVLSKGDIGESLSPTKVNAQYTAQYNSIDLPAGVLQGVFFNKNRLHSMNYGGIGFFIGHEITHGFDSEGRRYDKDGNLATWWTENVSKAFEKQAECIVRQYSNYTIPELDVKLDGKLTESENIADNGGVKQAYLAYNSWVERNNPEAKLPGLNYTALQLFWISAASCWCSKETEAGLRSELIDEHPPGRYRIIGTFSNLDYFAKDFNCLVGSKMNPQHKCKVW